MLSAAKPDVTENPKLVQSTSAVRGSESTFISKAMSGVGVIHSSPPPETSLLIPAAELPQSMSASRVSHSTLADKPHQSTLANAASHTMMKADATQSVDEAPQSASNTTVTHSMWGDGEPQQTLKEIDTQSSFAKRTPHSTSAAGVAPSKEVNQYLQAAAEISDSAMPQSVFYARFFYRFLQESSYQAAPFSFPIKQKEDLLPTIHQYLTSNHQMAMQKDSNYISSIRAQSNNDSTLMQDLVS